MKTLLNTLAFCIFVMLFGCGGNSYVPDSPVQAQNQNISTSTQTQGPMGPAGPVGPMGPTGPTGPPGPASKIMPVSAYIADPTTNIILQSDGIPSVTVVVGDSGTVLLTVSAQVTTNASGFDVENCTMTAWAVPTIPANNHIPQALLTERGSSSVNETITVSVSDTSVLTGLTPGTTLFSANYRVGSLNNPCSWSNRQIIAVPY